MTVSQQICKIKATTQLQCSKKSEQQGRGYTLKHQECKTDTFTLTPTYTIIHTQINWYVYNHSAKESQKTEIRSDLEELSSDKTFMLIVVKFLYNLNDLYNKILYLCSGLTVVIIIQKLTLQIKISHKKSLKPLQKVIFENV